MESNKPAPETPRKEIHPIHLASHPRFDDDEIDGRDQLFFLSPDSQCPSVHHPTWQQNSQLSSQSQKEEIEEKRPDQGRKNDDRKMKKRAGTGRRLVEYEEIQQILDHVVSIGAEWERKKARWKAHHDLQLEDSDVSKRRKLFHFEDCRIYEGGKHYFDGEELENQSKEYIEKLKEKSWEEEHGDFIHPIRFHNEKLVTIRKNKKRRRQQIMNNDDESFVDISCTSTKSPKKEDVAKEWKRNLLTRCWQRAVHAMSCTVHVDSNQKNNDHKNEDMESTGNTKTEEYFDEKSVIERTRAQCDLLGIDTLEGNNNECPSCHEVFPSFQACERHYFYESSSDLGIDDNHCQNNMFNNHRGCCWNLIKEKKRDILRFSMESEVESIVKQIGALLWRFNSIEDHRSLSWQDVVQIFNTIVENFQKKNNSSSGTAGATTTIQPDAHLPPIALNSVVMDAVHSRLVDRYACVNR